MAMLTSAIVVWVPYPFRCRAALQYFWPDNTVVAGPRMFLAAISTCTSLWQDVRNSTKDTMDRRHKSTYFGCCTHEMVNVAGDQFHVLSGPGALVMLVDDSHARGNAQFPKLHCNHCLNSCVNQEKSVKKGCYRGDWGVAGEAEQG